MGWNTGAGFGRRSVGGFSRERGIAERRYWFICKLNGMVCITIGNVLKQDCSHEKEHREFACRFNRPCGRQRWCRFLSLKLLSASAPRLQNASSPFYLTPLTPFNQHLPMNALEAGLKCPNRAASDSLSVLSVEMLASVVNFFNRSIVLTGAGRPARQMILRPRGSAQ